MVYPITRLEVERRKQGFSQWQLARRANIVQSRISLIERDLVEARQDEKECIARVLEKPLSELFPGPRVYES